MREEREQLAICYYLLGFRKVEMDGAHLDGIRVIKHWPDIDLDEYREAITSRDEDIWGETLQMFWEEIDDENDYHLPNEAFQPEEIDPRPMLSMVYPVVLSVKFKKMITAVDEVRGKHVTGGDALEKALQLIRSIEHINDDPFLALYTKVLHQIDALEIPQIIPFGRCELDEMKPFVITTTDVTPAKE